MQHRTPKPYFRHEIPWYYDWDGYKNLIEDYAIWFECRIRTQTRRKIYVRNFKLYPPKPLTPEQIEARQAARQTEIDSEAWTADFWGSTLWRRVRPMDDNLIRLLVDKARP